MYQRLGGMRINIRKMKKIYEIEKFLNIACSLVENKGKTKNSLLKIIDPKP